MTHTKNKITTTFVLLLVCATCYSNISFAQKPIEKKSSSVTFGGIVGGSLPLQKILDNPIITPKDPNCEVTDFTISFMPDGGEYWGPFKINGSKMTKNQLSYLSEFTKLKVRVFIEDIHLKCKNGDTSIASAVIITSTP
ncbi:MAG: hypothetical protein ACHQD8_07450 [Chitinophagales bacterium]